MFSSTLSLMAAWSVVAFTLAASCVGYGLAKGMEKEIAAVIMAPFSLLLTGFGMSYLTARKTGNGGANGIPEAPASEAPTTIIT